MKKLNLGEFIKFIILFMFLIYFIYIFKDKKYMEYVHPRMCKFILFSIIVFIVLTAYNIRKIFYYKKKKLKWNYFVLLIPIIIGFSTNSSNANSAVIAKNSRVSVSQQNANISQAPAQSISGIEKNDNTIKGDKVIYNDTNMSYVLNDMYEHPKKYENKKFEMTGFVYREKYFTKDIFVTGRMQIVCCAADAMLVGILTQGNCDMSAYKDNSWVKVSGVIKTRKSINKKLFNQDLMPYLETTKIQEVKSPANQYIY
jgi:putative membrane protein